MKIHTQLSAQIEEELLVKKLWFSVIWMAVHDIKKLEPSKLIRKDSSDSYKDYRAARNWILCENGDTFNSFGNLCEYLGLSSSKIRNRCKQIINEKEKQLCRRVRNDTTTDDRKQAQI